MMVLTPQLTDRKEAGLFLATRLQSMADQPCTIILALARGGIEVGWMMSRALHLPLKIFLARKLRFPGNPEYAIGAITETGETWLHPDIFPDSTEQSIPYHRYLDEELALQRAEIHRQRRVYRQERTLPELLNHTVILVDDGIATGSTFMASIASLRALAVGKIIGAIPVAPREAIHHIHPLVDHLVVLHTPDPFISVGTYYREFPQLKDEQIQAYVPPPHELPKTPTHPAFRNS